MYAAVVTIIALLYNPPRNMTRACVTAMSLAKFTSWDIMIEGQTSWQPVRRSCMVAEHGTAILQTCQLVRAIVMHSVGVTFVTHMHGDGWTGDGCQGTAIRFLSEHHHYALQCTGSHDC